MDWWKNRLTKLSQMRQQLKRPEARAALAVCSATRSKVTKYWHDLQHKASSRSYVAGRTKISGSAGFRSPYLLVANETNYRLFHKPDVVQSKICGGYDINIMLNETFPSVLLCVQITDAEAEAKDTFKYLQDIRHSSQVLYKGSPKEVIVALPFIMAGVYTMHTMARSASLPSVASSFKPMSSFQRDLELFALWR